MQTGVLVTLCILLKLFAFTNDCLFALSRSSPAYLASALDLRDTLLAALCDHCLLERVQGLLALVALQGSLHDRVLLEPRVGYGFILVGDFVVGLVERHSQSEGVVAADGA